MAVRMMIEGTEFPRYGAPDAVTPLTPEDCTAYGVSPDRPYHFLTFFSGAVLKVGEHNHYHDSDFYAVVWNAAEGKPETVEYGTTRFPTYGNRAEVDATDSVKAAYAAYMAEVNRQEAARRAEVEAATASVGKVVVVIKGRKLAHGTRGEVFWYGRDKYSRLNASLERQGGPFLEEQHFEHRVGIKTDAGEKVFLSEDNLEVDQAATVQRRLDRIGAVIWGTANATVGTHPDDITMKLMEIAGEWHRTQPERCAKLDAAVDDIDNGNLERALTLVTEALR